MVRRLLVEEAILVWAAAYAEAEASSNMRPEVEASRASHEGLRIGRCRWAFACALVEVTITELGMAVRRLRREIEHGRRGLVTLVEGPGRGAAQGMHRARAVARDMHLGHCRTVLAPAGQSGGIYSRAGRAVCPCCIIFNNCV